MATRIPLLSLLLLASFASFCAVLPAPALPDISHYFHVTAAKTESIMSVYLLGYGLGQLFYGLLANRYGRKPTLRIGIFIALLAGILSLVSVAVKNYELLVISRLLMAMGASAGLVISMILIKDCYDAINARRTFAKIVLAFAGVPFVAIALGGSLTHYLGWKSLLIVMIMYATALILLVQFLPETLPSGQRRRISYRHLLITWMQLLKQSNYLILIALFTLSGATTYVFNELAPIIAIQKLHISAALYGWLSFIPSLGILLGGLFSSRFVHKFTAQQMIRYGVLLTLGGSLALVMLFAGYAVNLFSLYGAAIVIFCGTALVTPNASMEALACVTDHANGASLMNTLALLSSSFFVTIAGRYVQLSVLVLPLALLALAILALLLISTSFVKLKKEKVIRG